MMAMIDDPTAVAFANEFIRPSADRMLQAYYFAKRMIDRWNALGGTSMIPDSGDTIDDGADADGRPVITGSMAVNVVTRAIENVAEMEANSKAKLNTLLAVGVNLERS